MAFGLRGLSPLLAFGLGAFAAAAAVRQLVLSTRRLGWRGLVGRANGGMIVHLGVVMVAVAFAATQAYAHRAEFRLSPGQTAHLAGHRVTYLGSSTVKHPNRTSLIASVRVDPTDSDIAYVAALGHAHGPNPERGVYRTRDGGAGWELVLHRGDDVGAADLCIDPRNPRILYATLWQDRKSVV